MFDYTLQCYPLLKRGSNSVIGCTFELVTLDIFYHP